jgi:hypothetical protein
MAGYIADLLTGLRPLASADLALQSAAIGATTVYTAPASGQYRVSWNAKVTTADGTSSTLGGANGFQVTYTDADDSVVVTTPAWWGSGNNGAAPSSASADTAQAWAGGSAVVNAGTGTDIQYSFDYTSNTPGQMVYSLHVRVEKL